MVSNEPQEYWERALKETAHVVATKVAGLRKRPNTLIICGARNKILAKYIMLEAQRVGATPFLWEFNEDFFLYSAGLL